MIRHEIIYVRYNQLTEGMFFMSKFGSRVNQVTIITNDRILYKSILTGAPGTLKLLQCKDRIYIDMSGRLPVVITSFDDCPF